MSDFPADIWSPDIAPSFPHGTVRCHCCYDDSHATLLDVLKSVEWSGGGEVDECGWCPVCSRWWEQGHAPDCRLAAALRAATP